MQFHQSAIIDSTLPLPFCSTRRHRDQVSESLLSIYLREYEDPPWDALKYLIAGVMYGGHVTDDWDRRLLMTYINQMFNEDVLGVTYYKWVAGTRRKATRTWQLSVHASGLGCATSSHEKLFVQ